MYTLKDADYEGYLVGGCVRDLLLGHHPKDFDVATNATPEQVKALFRNSRIIGRRFQIVHVRFGREIIEVTTFRGPHDGESTQHVSDEGMLLRDNVYGTLEQDAWRRDFTINALYYTVKDFSIVDYTHGMADLQSKTIRMIGDPEVRFKEDPVRMLRAIRFAGKLNFKIQHDDEVSIKKALDENIHLLEAVSSARLFDEVLKLFMSGYAKAVYELLIKEDVYQRLFPFAQDVDSDFYIEFVKQGLVNTDIRIQQQKPVTPAFLFAVLLWPAVEMLTKQLQSQDIPLIQAVNIAGQEMIEKANACITIPKRFRYMMRDIWTLQVRLPNRAGRRAYKLLEQKRFRAGYDFLLLRSQVSQVASNGSDVTHSTAAELAELANWWTQFQTESEAGRKTMLNALPHPRPKSRKKKTKHA
ncbi:Poly(A) polymerase [hydrothermal vent metagenome]|uniref:Poly(A) polymerase n=1 Tax=hydrothermal vent metagenome TaxID=652676 RepID=A0A3B1A0L2_9ZZZZ